MAEMSLADLAQYFGGAPRSTGLAALAPQEGGAPTGPNDPLNSPGALSALVQGMAQHYGTPGAVMQPNPYPPGSEEASWYDQQRQSAMSSWAPGMALGMLGAGTPMAEAGALGAGGGRLRNQFTGAFRKGGETPLPGNPYRAVNTQAKPVAANSAEVVSRTQAPTPADPALVESNLSRMDNPMMQQMQPPQAASPPSVNPADVQRWKAILQNGFGQ